MGGGGPFHSRAQVIKMLQNYTLNAATWLHPTAKQWPKTAGNAMQLCKANSNYNNYYVNNNNSKNNSNNESNW